jgi:hypothetical protein
VLSGEVESPTLTHQAFGCEFQPTHLGEVKELVTVLLNSGTLNMNGEYSPTVLSSENRCLR